MIVTIAEQFTSDPSDRERSPTIIWKPGLKVLARGLKFIPSPRNINKTEVLADFKKFGRRMRLKEFFHDKNNSTESETSDTNENDYETGAFRKSSTFTPKPNREPALDLYLKHLENSIMKAKPRKNKSNIPTRKNKNIVIFEADKGGAVVIMNKSDYINEARKHLNSVDADGNRIYKELSYDCTEKFVRDVARPSEKQLSTKL